MKTLLTVLLLAALVDFASSHGRLLVPPQRSSMWRAGFPVDANYDDNGLNCGGLSNQFSRNGGQCGVCGDPFQGPFPNEAGGKYASGIIGKNYIQGEIMQVTVELTSNHLGYFEFRLCPHNNPNTKVNQTCLDQNLLLVQVQGQWLTKYYPGSKGGYHNFDIKLPNDVKCTQCVLQWKYRAGNNWGCSTSEGCCSGCGKQEHFINCADIAITTSTSATETSAPSSPTSFSPPSTSPKTSATTFETSPASESSTTPMASTSGCHGKAGWQHLSSWCHSTCASGYCPESICTCAVEEPVCRAIGLHALIPGMADWCAINCAQNNCVPTYCACS